MRFALHSKAVAVAASVLALGTVGLTALTSGASGAAGLRAQTANGSGYWLAGSDGGVFAFGTAQFYGSLAGKPLAAPITGIVATSDDHGYWLTGRDGAIYPFGDATAQGSMAGTPLAAAVVGVAATHPPGTGGTTGPRGPAGPVGFPNFAYIFNIGAQTVIVGGSVAFDSRTAVAGFTHTDGTAAITVTSSGVYRIDTFVSTSQGSSRTAVFVNGAAVGGSSYGSGTQTDVNGIGILAAAAGQQNNGRVVIGLFAGDVVTLRNSSTNPITLQVGSGGTPPLVNASMTVQQIGTIPP